MNKIAKNVLAALGAVCSINTTAALAEGDPAEFFQLLVNVLPETIGSQEANARLLEKWLKPPIAEPQLSKAFDPVKASTAVDRRTRLLPQADCFRRKPPLGDPSAVNDDCVYQAGDPAGSGPAVKLRFNLPKGKIAYLHRARSFDAGKSPGVEIKPEAATELALNTARSFGIPLSELAMQHLDVRELFAAASPTTRGETVQKRAEIHVRIPRIVGELPVFDSGLMVAVGANSAGAPQVARLRTAWPDFAILPGLSPEQALDREELIRHIAEDLAEDTHAQTLDVKRTQAFIAYVPAAHMDLCADPGDEDGAEKEPRPQDLSRAYVPALVLFSVPNEEVDPNNLSTAVAQQSFPLLKVPAAACDGDGSV